MANKIEANLENIHPLNIGLKEKDIKIISKHLTTLLANTYCLYLKTQNYHWNISGPLFFSLHQLLEEQYQEMANSVDEIAERIRILGETVPASFLSFNKLASIKDENGYPTANEMVHQLISDHETLIVLNREMLSQIQEMEDDVTIHLMIEQMAFNEKSSWKLRSLQSRRNYH